MANLKFSEETKIQVTVPLEVSEDNMRDIHEVLSVRRHQNGTVTEAQLNLPKLQRILLEWRLYTSTRRVIEIEILKLFDKHSDFHISEIREKLKEIKVRTENSKEGKPTPPRISKVRISQALAELVKEDWLEKPGRGMYRRKR